METKICCICGKRFEGYVNNPYPVVDEGQCCDQCNQTRVLPARIRLMRESYSI